MKLLKKYTTTIDNLIAEGTSLNTSPNVSDSYNIVDYLHNIQIESWINNYPVIVKNLSKKELVINSLNFSITDIIKDGTAYFFKIHNHTSTDLSLYLDTVAYGEWIKLENSYYVTYTDKPHIIINNVHYFISPVLENLPFRKVRNNFVFKLDETKDYQIKLKDSIFTPTFISPYIIEFKSTYFNSNLISPLTFIEFDAKDYQTNYSSVALKNPIKNIDTLTQTKISDSLFLVEYEAYKSNLTFTINNKNNYFYLDIANNNIVQSIHILEESESFKLLGMVNTQKQIHNKVENKYKQNELKTLLANHLYTFSFIPKAINYVPYEKSLAMLNLLDRVNNKEYYLQTEDGYIFQHQRYVYIEGNINSIFVPELASKTNELLVEIPTITPNENYILYTKEYI